MTRVLRMNHRRMLIVAVAVLALMVLYIYEHLYDSCEGKIYTRALCEQFEKGWADGLLCADLCQHHTLHLWSCSYDLNGHRLFHYGNYYLKVPNSRFQSSPIVLDDVFMKPSQGIDVEEFYEMVKQFLIVKIGSGQHTELLEDIMGIADVNKDSKISLAEAKTIWALLRHNEFFMLLMLHHVPQVPRLKGFCGDMYAVEAVNHTQLYIHPVEGWLGGVITTFHQWNWPKWNIRGKIAVGMLEFVSDIYHHRSNGMVYLCDASENSFGYTDNYDLMVTNLHGLRPRHELEQFFEDQACFSEADCHFPNNCMMKCDAEQHKCSADLIKPNLYHICQLISEYLRPNAPRMIRAELYLLLDRCINLNTSSPHLEMDHVVISNDLRSLLWHYISDYIS